MGERNCIQMANAARPKCRRNHFLANIEIRSGLAWTASKTSAIHKQRLAVRRDQQNRVALSNVDSLNQQCVMRVVNRPRDHGRQRRKQHGSPCETPLPLRAARQQNRRGQQ